MSEQFSNDDARYVRTKLGEALDIKPDVVRARSMAPGENPSHWVNLPVVVFQQMLSAVRGEDEDKPFPHTFMSGRVIMAARIPVKPGLARHQAVIAREYEQDGKTLYSVHYLVAQRTTDPWQDEHGSYDITTREAAFDEFSERMYRRGNLSRDRRGINE